MKEKEILAGLKKTERTFNPASVKNGDVLTPEEYFMYGHWKSNRK